MENKHLCSAEGKKKKKKKNQEPQNILMSWRKFLFSFDFF